MIKWFLIVSITLGVLCMLTSEVFDVGINAANQSFNYESIGEDDEYNF